MSSPSTSATRPRRDSCTAVSSQPHSTRRAGCSRPGTDSPPHCPHATAPAGVDQHRAPRACAAGRGAREAAARDGSLTDGNEVLAEARAAFLHVPLEHFLATARGARRQMRGVLKSTARNADKTCNHLGPAARRRGAAMLKQIVAVGVCIFALMLVVKDGRVLPHAGPTGSGRSFRPTWTRRSSSPAHQASSTAGRRRACSSGQRPPRGCVYWHGTAGFPHQLHEPLEQTECPGRRHKKLRRVRRLPCVAGRHGSMLRRAWRGPLTSARREPRAERRRPRARAP